MTILSQSNTLILVQPLLLKPLLSFPAFSYNTIFYCPPPTNVLNFILRFLLWHQNIWDYVAAEIFWLSPTVQHLVSLWPSPMKLILVMSLLLWCLLSFCAFSPMAPNGTLVWDCLFCLLYKRFNKNIYLLIWTCWVGYGSCGSPLQTIRAVKTLWGLIFRLILDLCSF